MKSKNEWMTAKEMRMARREIINSFLQSTFKFDLSTIKMLVRRVETSRYYMHLARYYYYEYHQKTS